MNNDKQTVPKRVLIVDDSKVTRQVIRTILESDAELAVVGEAENGAEGVKMAAELLPDVITMDLNMPVMNGGEATRQIMQNTPIPIVVVTSVSYEEQIHEGLDILLDGALEIVQKPGSWTTQTYGLVSAELLAKVKSVAYVTFSPADSSVS